MTPLTWAILLLTIGLLLVLVELFVPSGGVLGFLSTGTIIASVVMAFRHSSTTGLGFMAIVVFGTPVIVAMGFKVWPRTPIGRRILLDVPRGDDVLPDDDLRRQLKDLVGKIGQARTLMLPGGPVDLGGRSYDAVSEGQPVQPGTAVKVIDVRGTRIVVRPTNETVPEAARDPKDPLSASIEQLGLNPFEDPFK